MQASKRLQIGVLVDRQMLARWQLDALRTLGDECDFIIYNCRNTSPPPRRWSFALYYLLNLGAIRNRMTRRQPWPADLRTIATRDFDAVQDRAWQSLPADLIKQFRTDRVDLLLKFGMGLVRVPPTAQLPIPILSYHHGDPTKFRGRPAGFYELCVAETVMGQVVQRISNDLDSGEVLASAETKILPHSYRSTLVEAYSHSPLILKKAVGNAIAGGGLTLDGRGRNYRLPNNAQTLKFVAARWIETLRRLLYGLFIEKRWQVATIALPETTTIKSLESVISRAANWRKIPTPKGYRFLADPFLHPGEGVLVEGMNRGSGRGEILHVGRNGTRRLSGPGGHYSYPACLSDGERSYIVPEISDWSPAKAFLLSDGKLHEAFDLKIPGRPALLDPTPYRVGDTLYLFANRADEGPTVLRLWIASQLHGEFAEHPCSPIRISPKGSRMAGNLTRIGGNLYRVGQDLRERYGDGLMFFRITRIDKDHYSEVAEHSFRLGHVRGPHTLNLGQDRAVFDFYVERFTPFAGVRRLREKRAARQIQ